LSRKTLTTSPRSTETTRPDGQTSQVRSVTPEKPGRVASDCPTRMAYIAIAACGCVPAFTVDESEYQEDVAEDIGKWIVSGRTVERVTMDEARERLTMDCPHTPKWGKS
jgi:hypothetical protein